MVENWQLCLDCSLIYQTVLSTDSDFSVLAALDELQARANE
jgi:hypothetical protein